MDKAHKQVMTTDPMAIRMGQGRVHVQDAIQWHLKSEAVQCPECEAVFIVSVGFPQDKLLVALKKQHADKQQHPDVIPSGATWPKIIDCTCGM
jgi:hypothetical protein